MLRRQRLYGMFVTKSELGVLKHTRATEQARFVGVPIVHPQQGRYRYNAHSMTWEARLCRRSRHLTSPW